MAEIAECNPRGLFAVRAAGTLLRSLGSGTVTLRYAERVVGGDPRQLGLLAPATEDVRVGPALLRYLEPEEGKRVYEVVLTAESVAAEVERRGERSAEELFASVLGVVRDEALWRLQAVSAKNLAGIDVLYRLKVTE